VLAGALASLWSFMVGDLVVAPLHERFRHGSRSWFATIAVAIAIQEFCGSPKGRRIRWLPPLFNEPIALIGADGFVVTLTPMQIAVALMALARRGPCWCFACQSRSGASGAPSRTIPARRPCSASRAPARRPHLRAGRRAGGARGWIVAVYYGNVSFSMGHHARLKALVAAVIAASARCPAPSSAALVGLIEAGWSAYSTSGSATSWCSR